MSRNNVSVTLSGRDQLSGVLQKASGNISKVASAGRLLAGLGLASALLRMGGAAKALAKDMGPDLQKELQRSENLMQATVQTMIESTIGTDGMSTANDFLAEQVLPRVITAFEMTRDAIKAVIEFIGRAIKIYRDFVNRVMDGLGKIIPGYNKLRNVIGENIQRFVQWGEAQVASRREALQNTLAIREQNQAVEAANNAYKKYIDSIIGLTDNLNTLTQEEVNSIRASLQVEVQRLTAEEQATALGERRLQLTRDRRAAEEALTRATSVQTAGEGIATRAQRSHTTAVTELSNATGHLVGLNERHINELEKLILTQRASAQANFAKAKGAEAAAAANAILLETEAALLRIEEERQRRFAESAEGRAAAAIAEQKTEMQMAMEQLAQDITNIAEDTVGIALSDTFANLFNVDLSSNFEQLRKTVLAGLGDIFSQMGRTYIAASGIFSSIGKAIANPFTAGPALALYGAALVALGGSISGIARGGSGGNTMERPVGRLQLSGLSGREFGGEAKLIIQGGLLDMSDPRQASALGRAIGELSGRRVILQGA